MKETIVIGDCHGVREEFNRLLDQINYDPTSHRVILVGDIIDRGVDPVGLVAQIRDMGIESVKGNHEEKLIRWRRHEDIKALTGRPNPMEVEKNRRKEWEKYSNSDIRWMADLPHSIRVNDDWIVVHAGMEPAFAVDDQDQDTILRIRYVDEKGLYQKINPKKPIPKGSFFWAERWDKPINIVFGHQKHPHPTIYGREEYACVAVDTGAVFGGYLTAYHIEQNKFSQVKSKRQYY